MQPLLAWIFLAIVVERLIEILGKLFPVLDEINIKQFNIKMFISLVLGGVFAFGASLDFFFLVGIDFAVPYIGYVISSVFIAAGSNYVSDIIGTLGKVKETEVIVVEIAKED